MVSVHKSLKHGTSKVVGLMAVGALGTVGLSACGTGDPVPEETTAPAESVEPTESVEPAQEETEDPRARDTSDVEEVKLAFGDDVYLSIVTLGRLGDEVMFWEDESLNGFDPVHLTREDAIQNCEESLESVRDLDGYELTCEVGDIQVETSNRADFTKLEPDESEELFAIDLNMNDDGYPDFETVYETLVENQYIDAEEANLPPEYE